MNENRKPHLIPLRVAAVLLVLVMMTTSLVTGRYARYTTSDSGEDSARIAAFVFDVRDTSGHIVDLTEISKPGDSKIFEFTVANHIDSKVVSEVEEEYVLTMELRGSLPLVCTLTGADNITLSGVGGEENGAKHVFDASVEESKTYKLTVTWPGTETDIKYSRAGIAQLVVSIAAQQTD